MGIQDVHPLLPEETPQINPSPEIPPPAERKEENREPFPASPSEKFPPRVAGQQEAVPPTPHDPGLRANPLFLSPPAKGGLRVQNGVSARRSGH